MKLLFLRGHAGGTPSWTKLSDCDDMWTQLAYRMLDSGDYGELWYEKGEGVARYAENFMERRVARVERIRPSFQPDVLFCRGGFPYQLEEAKRQPKAFKIYYGAGARVVPKAGQPWDLVLADVEKQLAGAMAAGYRSVLWRKPAAENIFHPMTSGAGRRFDVIYVANWNANAFKGHQFLLPALRGYRVLHLGDAKKAWPFKFPNVHFAGRQPRRLLPGFYAQAKVAVIMTKGKDSAARVIPEALACNCPIVVGRCTRIGEDYVTPETGAWFTTDNFQDVLADVLARWESFSPRRYYDAHLFMRQAVEQIRGLIH